MSSSEISNTKRVLNKEKKNEKKIFIYRFLFNRIPSRDYNSFGSRRGNDVIMTRGTFNHVRLNNKLVVKRQPSLLPSSSPSPQTTTLYLPTNIEMDIFDASEHYRNAKIPLIVLAGKDYGCGPSRDWVAKGPWMLVCRIEIKISKQINNSNFSGCSSCSC